jgi:hypothetical protein
MPEHEIYITDSDPSSGSLTLSDGGTTKVNNVFNRTVFWEIADTKIESFRIEGKLTSDPFTERPGKEFAKHTKLKVRFLAPTGDWNYTIVWYDKATHTEHRYDPKIAVEPLLGYTGLVIIVAFTVVSFLSLRFFRTRRKINS